jgi:hypothetical protein
VTASQEVAESQLVELLEVSGEERAGVVVQFAEPSESPTALLYRIRIAMN